MNKKFESLLSENSMRLSRRGVDVSQSIIERRRLLRRPRSRLGANTQVGNMIVNALRQLYDLAIYYQLMDKKPTLELKCLKSSNKADVKAWTPNDIAAYEATHKAGTMARLALDLMLYTGQSRGDIVHLGVRSITGGRLKWTQIKSGATLEIPIRPALAASIEATPMRGFAFLETERGVPFNNANSLSNRMRKWCDEAGRLECSVNGLRKSASERLAEAGCRSLEIMAITGHEIQKEIERYTKVRRQVILGDCAMQRLLEAGESEKAIPLRDEQSNIDLTDPTKPLIKKDKTR